MSDIRWAYALNSWKPTYDSFARAEQHARALKTVSVSGFRAVEIAAGPGRWEPMGNREMMEVNHGSVAGFRDFLKGCAVDALSSYFLDPGVFLSRADGAPLAAANPANRDEIVELAREYIALLPALGGDRLVVKPAPAWWRGRGISDETLANVAACWNAVADAAKGTGVQIALHLDCLSAVRDEATIARLLDATDPDRVGIAIDTAEATLAGLDPVALYGRFSDRVNHVQFKDVLLRDDLGEATKPHAEANFLSAGGQREVARWFYEMGAPGGLVDFPAMLDAMKKGGYRGWIVAEADQSPYPATSAMLNGWYLKNRLSGHG